MTIETVHKCPPHHFIINSEGVGHCKYCPAVKDFGKQQKEVKGDAYGDGGSHFTQCPQCRKRGVYIASGELGEVGYLLRCRYCDWEKEVR